DEYFTTDDVAQEMKLRYSMANEYGFYLAPGLAQRLGAAELTTRVKAIHAFKAIADDAVMPLITLLRHPDGSTVLGAISALKAIKNSAAVPMLKLVAETGADAQIKKAALEAVQEISPGAASQSAYDLLVTQAKTFYLDSRYMSRTHHEPVTWKLEGDALTYADVHSWALNELRAEQLLEVAMAQPGDDASARALFASVSIAQWVEYDAIRDQSQDEATQNELRSEEPKMLGIRIRANMESEPIILGALAGAMRDNRPLVAIGAIQVLNDRFPRGNRADTIPSVLAEAQNFPHRGVRFAASECIAYMNPKSSFSSADKVIPNLNEGLVEAGGRLALLVLEDQDDENTAREKLRLSNVASFNVPNALDALHDALAFPHDLIILGMQTQGMMTGELIGRLRNDPRTQAVPILVMADDDMLTKAEQAFGNMAESGVQIVNYSIRPEALRDDVIAPLFAGNSDPRSRDIEIAGRAAEAIDFLATLNAGRDTIFDLSSTDRALVEVLENRTDIVRIPACHAVGKLGFADAIAPLKQILHEGDASSVDLRVAAIDALGKVSRVAGSNDPEIAELLEAGLTSDEPMIRKVSASAIGNAGVKPAVYRD
ncbi:MAG: hypothetical protein KC609_05945, partial [Myxococcales bacterium]|nr:hypothetical protein [Myxococcales bacterium]